MARTKAFLSYSHQDGAWRDRLMTHLAILERRELIHVWADTRINVGETWQTEIENALRESRVAILLISPAFLAACRRGQSDSGLYG
jgi:predicted nucleotide-binding protein